MIYLLTFQKGFLISCFQADRFVNLELGIPVFKQIHSLLQEVTKWLGAYNKTVKRGPVSYM